MENKEKESKQVEKLNCRVGGEDFINSFTTPKGDRGRNFDVSFKDGNETKWAQVSAFNELHDHLAKTEKGQSMRIDGKLEPMMGKDGQPFAPNGEQKYKLTAKAIEVFQEFKQDVTVREYKKGEGKQPDQLIVNDSPAGTNKMEVHKIAIWDNDKDKFKNLKEGDRLHIDGSLKDHKVTSTMEKLPTWSKNLYPNTVEIYNGKDKVKIFDKKASQEQAKEAAKEQAKPKNKTKEAKAEKAKNQKSKAPKAKEPEMGV